MTSRLKLAALAGFAAVALTPAVGLAHFILQAPASAIVENQLGDPQKAAPCGIAEGVASTPSGAVTPAVGVVPSCSRTTLPRVFAVTCSRSA